MALESYDSFEAVKTRLDEIVDAVSDDELALDDALALYEEAVGSGCAPATCSRIISKRNRASRERTRCRTSRPTMCPHRRRVRRFRRSPC